MCVNQSLTLAWVGIYVAHVRREEFRRGVVTKHGHERGVDVQETTLAGGAVNAEYSPFQ
jgi:hypothetical protein